MRVQQLTQIFMGVLLASGMEARVLPPTNEHISTHLAARSEGALNGRMKHTEPVPPRPQIVNRLRKRTGVKEKDLDLRRRMERFCENLQIDTRLMWGPYASQEEEAYGTWLKDMFHGWATKERAKGEHKSHYSIREAFKYQKRVRARVLAEARNNAIQPHAQFQPQQPQRQSQQSPVPGKLTMTTEEYLDYLRQKSQVSGPREMPFDDDHELGPASPKKKVKMLKKEDFIAPEDARMHGNLFASKEEATNQQQQPNSRNSRHEEATKQEFSQFNVPVHDSVSFDNGMKKNLDSEGNPDDFWSKMKADPERIKALHDDFKSADENQDLTKLEW